MKNYCISVDITMSKTLEVEAESEQQAKNIVCGKFKANPYDLAYGFTSYVNHEITDVEEITED